MKDEDLPRTNGLSRRGLYVVGFVALVVACAGFFVGVAQERREGRAEPGDEVVATAPAPGYRELREMRRGPNAGLYGAAFDPLRGRLPGVLAAVPDQTEAQRAEVLAARSEKRAFDGAPPTIPHAISAQGPFECLACHEKGAVIAGKLAPMMSHERHDSCLQCHVAAGGPPSPPPAPLAANTFEGERSAARGERAWPTAPPTIPHSTWMRSSCGSCHGVAGALGMRSTHPWRENCLQCHAPSASLDQRPSALAPVGSSVKEGTSR